MTIPEDPIGKKPRDPYSGYKTERIEADKHEHEPFEEISSSKEKTGTLLFFILKKFIEVLSRLAPQEDSTEEKEINLRGLMILFQAALETIKMEDRSQDLAFLNRLAELWHDILERSSSFRSNKKLMEPLQKLMKEIEHYPEKASHTLGYYLKEGAGQNWIPFPYMELIQQLHQAHAEDPILSPLKRWTDAIQELFPLIDEEK